MPRGANETSRDQGTVREALRHYHAESGFAGDAMTSDTIAVRVFGHAADLSSPRSWRALLARHDLHHVLIGYATDLSGEAELGAWELAAGPWHWLSPPGWAELPSAPVPALRGLASRARWVALGAFAWLDNGAALALGVLAPVRTLRAFARGLAGRSLYPDELAYDALLDMRVDEPRARLRIRPR